MPPRYVNPHLNIYVRAQSVGCQPPEEPQLQELRRKYDLGGYTVEALEELMDELADTLTAWVEAHPPYEPE